VHAVGQSHLPEPSQHTVQSDEGVKVLHADSSVSFRICRYSCGKIRAVLARTCLGKIWQGSLTPSFPLSYLMLHDSGLFPQAQKRASFSHLLQRANELWTSEWVQSLTLGRRLWAEKNKVDSIRAAPRLLLQAPGPGRILICLVCQESPGLTWGHASDGGGTGRKALWGVPSPRSTETCKHLLIPRHGLRHWFTSNRSKL
jgi:hypothetical protein